MSQLIRRRFEVQAGAKSPFLPQKHSEEKNLSKASKGLQRQETKEKGPSGSNWNELHLNWLHIFYECGSDLNGIFSQESELSLSSKIAIYLRENLDGKWEWICNNDHEKSNSIFGLLQALVHQREEDDVFNTQSSTRHLTPPSAKSEPVTPQQHWQAQQNSPRNREQTPTPSQSRRGGLYSQLYMPEPRGRKRQREEVISPQREREGTMIIQGRLEDTPTGLQQRGGSPITLQPDSRIMSHPLQGSLTPSRHMASPTSPLACRQQDPKMPSREVKIQRVSGGQKKSQNTQPASQDVGASTSMDLRDQETHSTTWDKELDNGEEEDNRKKTVEEDNGEEHSEEEEYDKGEADELKDDDEEEDNDDVENVGGFSEAASSDKSEKEVEAAGRAFLSIVQDAIKNTKDGLDPRLVADQNLKFDLRDPRSLRIQIDKVYMSTHPDLVLEIFFGKMLQRRRIGVVLEFKRRDHHLSPEAILGQEVSELLGAALEKKAARKQDSYTSYLISWHGLKAYFSRLNATREYLDQLQQNSRALQDMNPPKVRRSELFDLTDPEDRISVAIGCARIAIEELLQFKRNHKSGLMERIRA